MESQFSAPHTMQMQLPVQQRRSAHYDVATAQHQHQQLQLQHQQQAAAAAATQGYSFPRRPSLPASSDMFDPTAGVPFPQHSQFDGYPQQFQPRGSIALSARSSGSSPYNSASPMPTTPTGMEQPMVNPWLLPFALNAMGAMPLPNPQFWFGKAPPGRQRTNQACEKCRDRKTKCTGERPSCSRCSQRGYICEYASEHRVRGPAKNRRRNASSIDLTSSTPISPTFSPSDRAVKSDVDGDVSPVASTRVAGQDDQWNQLDGIAEDVPPLNLFQDWLQQNNSSLGLTIPSADVAKNEDMRTSAHAATGFPEASSNAHLGATPSGPSNNYVRYSLSMPQLHLPYDTFGQAIPLASTLPAPLAMRHASVPAVDGMDEVVWPSQPFGQSQPFVAEAHLQNRTDDSNLQQRDITFGVEAQPPTYAFPSSQSPARYGAARGHEVSIANERIREYAQPSPVPSSNGYWIALSRKPTPNAAPKDLADSYRETSSPDTIPSDHLALHAQSVVDDVSHTESAGGTQFDGPHIVHGEAEEGVNEDDSETLVVAESSKDSLFDDSVE